MPRRPPAPIEPRAPASPKTAAAAAASSARRACLRSRPRSSNDHRRAISRADDHTLSSSPSSRKRGEKRREPAGVGSERASQGSSNATGEGEEEEEEEEVVEGEEEEEEVVEGEEDDEEEMEEVSLLLPLALPWTKIRPRP